MTPSIRTFLLINLLLSVTLITSFAIVGNLFLAHKDIQAQLDADLIRTGLRIQSFMTAKLSPEQLDTIQQNLIKTFATHSTLENTGESNNATDAINPNNTVEFQIWDKNGNPVLRSATGPTTPLSDGKPGLSTLWIDGNSWRVNTSYNPENQFTVMIAERANYRQQLENQLTQDAIFIMLITYPFLGFLIWVIVGRGLGSLKQVAREVRNRESTNLSAVNIDEIPAEIEPLVCELNSLFARLQDSFERNKRFTADAAHELRTPLAALSAQVQVALRAETPEDRNKALLKVLSGVNRSTHVVQQLLTLSRMDPDAGINDPSDVNIARLAGDIAALLAPEAIAKNIDLELLAPDMEALIWGNSTSIGILLRNLIDNAIRYTQENGRVTIDIQADNDTVTLIVSDNGPGIPEDLRQRVFERFFRVMGSKSTGSGLGLGIVMQIAKLHKAEIQLATPADSQGLEVLVRFKRYHKDPNQ